jgi:hypothetical protein
MIARATIPTLILFALSTASLAGQDKDSHGTNASKNPAFEQFKLLAGEWVGKEQSKDGEAVHTIYKVSSGGSAVVETILPGTEHEMITVIHPDGDDLILTHYCMLGNQPQMRASGKGDGNKVEFKFVRATNMKSDKEMHMHDVTFTFVDKDTLRADWTLFNEGKPSRQEHFELKRKK